MLAISKLYPSHMVVLLELLVCALFLLGIKLQLWAKYGTLP